MRINADSQGKCGQAFGRGPLFLCQILVSGGGMSNAIVQATSRGSNGLLFVGWNQDQG